MRITDISNYVLSLCYSYNFKDGKYQLNIPAYVGVGSLLVRVADDVWFNDLLQSKEGESYERGKSCASGLKDCCWDRLILLPATIPAMAQSGGIVKSDAFVESKRGRRC